MDEIAFDTSDYELAWPREAFVHELRGLVAVNPSTTRVYYQLLSEAFVGEEPGRALRRNDPARPYSSLQSEAFLAALLAHSGELPAPSVLRPYWPTRQGRGPWRLTREDLYRRFAQLIADMRRDGYLDSAFAEPCPSSEDGPNELGRTSFSPNGWGVVTYGR
ncbi:hypothetical protein ACL02T_10170 [Pseudonocardia sp. RS010]|uniref:hypothetical protein n=1 Tax=Pseudonocardia sp. RS010 TaxID=3385979 RepID=UPI0039A05469